MADIATLTMARLALETEEIIEFSQTVQLRGYIARRFPECDLLHNHEIESGKDIYRYPVFQYKVIHGLPMIVAVGDEAASLLEKIAGHIDELELGRRFYKVRRRIFEGRRRISGQGVYNG